MLCINEYYTVESTTETQHITEKSRFVCTVTPVSNRKNAEEALESIRIKYKDATHNCYAYRITPVIQKISDDKEPTGTAGIPILGVIDHHHLLYTLIVVSRYFGGTRLGTGGLIRAYQHSATLGINKAERIKKTNHIELTLTLNYTHLNKIQHQLREGPYHIKGFHYGEDIQCKLWVPTPMVEELKSVLLDCTNGEIRVHTGETKFHTAL